MVNGILRKDTGMFTCSIRLSDNFKRQFLPQTTAIVNVKCKLTYLINQMNQKNFLFCFYMTLK